MDKVIESYFQDLESQDKNIQYKAYQQIMTATEEKVDWAYEVWDRLKNNLTDRDNHKRSQAVQFLCNLAKSDPEGRLLEDFHAIWEVTKDQKFVTARHSLQSIWKIGLAGTVQKELVLKSLASRFINSTHEKNFTLIRFDIIQSLRNLSDEIKDEKVKQIALELIEKEEDPKYKKKYASVWKNV
ncbi:hypothetical protein SAMN05877753_10184 [Bacillus oleivorans]|uniref:HEAT repeat protein n=1 Tax=Bacillus oleivorans TaxID=1448271 RepID=A0A285CIF7_9BACI|nr:hypothetical protein [Bacillus oleivorans]SNX66773.1 hypothetical protein SAMN05877753_10184 [Bacillus oleivorans]